MNEITKWITYAKAQKRNGNFKEAGQDIRRAMVEANRIYAANVKEYNRKQELLVADMERLNKAAKEIVEAARDARSDDILEVKREQSNSY